MVPVYFFNKLTGQNYLFLNEASEGSPLVFLWQIFGTRFGEAGYLISFVVLALLVFHGLYLIYTGIGAFYEHKSRKCRRKRG